MMPTLQGRWQTRLILFLFVGLPVSLVFALARGGWVALAPEPLGLVAAMVVVGLLLDPLYQKLQRLRWDQDWPFALFAAASVFEFAVAFAAMRLDLLPGFEPCALARIDRISRALTCVDYTLPLHSALIQLTVILMLSLCCVMGIGQALIPRWRFKGGEFGGF